MYRRQSLCFRQDFSEWSVLQKAFADALVSLLCYNVRDCVPPYTDARAVQNLLSWYHAMKYAHHVQSTGKAHVSAAVQVRMENKFRQMIRERYMTEFNRRKDEF